MSFTILDDHFYLNGRKVFLNAGEIHYFRIRRELWDKHLEAAREAGLSAVSTYIPWAWHEDHEGTFDLDGSSCPERDLLGWLRRCREHGLMCIVKPGPFILAEFRGAGLPDWFLARYGDEVKMRDSRGRIVSSDGVNLFHPRYLEKVALWYDRVMPVIRDHQLQAGGPVIMMQVCNEIGVFSWLAHQADYGGDVRQRFVAFLAAKYKDIAALNKVWETDYPAFSGVSLPPDGRQPYSSPADLARDRDWHAFWRRYYGDYLRMLSQMARERSVTLPLYHNLPGWIYGHGYEFPVNITMYEDLYGEKSGILFGIDHIPEFLSHRNMHDDRIINDITRAMQGKGPLFAAEFQCGSREYHVVTNPRELELFYKASLAHGLTGWNYYMFSQGRNPSRKGYSGETFYWFTPLTPEGGRTSLFPLVRRMSRLIRTSEPLILEAKRRAEVCVLFYPSYYATELERPAEEACAMQFNPSAIRRPAWFDGLLKALQVLNIDYDMADHRQAGAASLAGYRQVWAFSTGEMDAADQQTLIDYASRGGQLVIFPCLPDRELSQQPCNLLRDATGVMPAGSETTDSPLIDVFDLKDIKCANPQLIYEEASLTGGAVIARTLSGAACGFRKTLGMGSVIHMGTWTGFDTEGHKPVYEAFLQQSGARLRQAEAGSDYLTVRERFTGDSSALLFVANYYNEAHPGRVSYTHPGTGEKVTIPYSGEDILWPPLYAMISPVCLEVLPGICLLHATSDLLDVAAGEGQVELTLYGDRDLEGEIVFEGGKTQQILRAGLDGLELKVMKAGSRVVLRYRHKHEREMKLLVTLG